MKFIVTLCVMLALVIVTTTKTHNLMITGGYRDTSPESVPKEVSDVAFKKALEAANEEVENKYAVRLIGIKTAKVQIVAGTNYKLEIGLEITNCSSSAHPDEVQHSEACPATCSYTSTLTVFRPLAFRRQPVAVTQIGFEMTVI